MESHSPAAANVSKIAATCDTISASIRSGKAKDALKQLSGLYDGHFCGKSHQEVLDTVRALNATSLLSTSLWPLATKIQGLRAKDTIDHVHKLLLIIVYLMNDRLVAQAHAAWRDVPDEAFQCFVSSLVSLKAGAADAAELTWTLLESTQYIQFFAHCFQSLDIALVARHVMPLVSLPMWTMLSPSQRQHEFQIHPHLERHWCNLMEAQPEAPVAKRRRTTGASKANRDEARPRAPTSAAQFIPSLLREFFSHVNTPLRSEDMGDRAVECVQYVAVMLTFLNELLAQLATRRFLHTVLRRVRFLRRCEASTWVHMARQWRSSTESASLQRQLDWMTYLMHFPIANQTGKSFAWREYQEEVALHVQTLQQQAFEPAFRGTPVEELALLPLSSVVDQSVFAPCVVSIVTRDRQRMEQLAVALALVADANEVAALSAEELVDCFVSEYANAWATEQHSGMLARVSNMKSSQAKVDSNESSYSESTAFALTELEIWSDLLENNSIYGIQQLVPVVPVRRVGLQYLNMADYVQRQYEIVRIQALSDVRDDLERTIPQLDPVRSAAGDERTVFRGFHPMANPLITAFDIVKVSKPALGETAPASVIAQFDIELSPRHNFADFDSMQKDEMVYLATIRATRDEAVEAMGYEEQSESGSTALTGVSFPEAHGVVYVRCARILDIEDEKSNSSINGGSKLKGRRRLVKVTLDGRQYRQDVEKGQLEAYETVNVMIRRPARTNAFPCVLTTLESLWHNSKKEEMLPAWLHDLFLGYGDPSRASHISIQRQRHRSTAEVRMDHVFLDGAHALEALSMPGRSVSLVTTDGVKAQSPEKLRGSFGVTENLDDGAITVRTVLSQGPGEDEQSELSLRVTPQQTEAIRKGLCEGLTIISGGLKDGEGDVASKLAANLYKQCNANEKILIMAKSPEKLNYLLNKVSSFSGVNPAHLVGLSDGENAPSIDKVNSFDWTTSGRVDFMLQRRLDLLQDVGVLAALVEANDPAQYAGLRESSMYSCENAQFFYNFHLKPVLSQWQSINKNDAPPVAKAVEQFAADRKVDLTTPDQVTSFVDRLFNELRSLQPFELLRSDYTRRDMYLVHHARVIAITPSYAARHHTRLLSLGLSFQSLVFEEATQLSEPETLLGFILACGRNVWKPTVSSNSSQLQELQRVVLIGDPAETLELASSIPFKQYVKMDQSLFTRLLRLGSPCVTLQSKSASESSTLAE